MLKFYFDRVLFTAYFNVWCKLHQLSLKEVGELSGLSYNTLQNIRTNEAAPHMETFLIICTLMDTNPREFFAEQKDGK